MPDTLRADARANRDHIIAAAQAMFAEHGLDVPMKDIADRAGVGVGTLYRRFPDRESLITATAHAHLTALARALETASREEGRAWPALRRFLGECITRRLGTLAAALEPGLHAQVQADPSLAAVRTDLSDAIARLTRQAQADGDVRRDVEPRDVALLMTVQVYARPEQSHPDALARVITIILSGLRDHPAKRTALPADGPEGGDPRAAARRLAARRHSACLVWVEIGP
jgi:AcrR family transcriptional regulator